MLSPKELKAKAGQGKIQEPRARGSATFLQQAHCVPRRVAPLAPLPPLVHTAPGPPLGKRNYFRNLKHNVLNWIVGLLQQTQTISETTTNTLETKIQHWSGGPS